MPFVAFVDHNGTDAVQLGIGKETLYEQARRDDLDPGAGPYLAITSDAVPDASANLLAAQFRHPPRRRPRRDPPRLRHDDLALEAIRQRQRYECGLPRPRRRHEDRAATPHGRDNVAEHLPDRQPLHVHTCYDRITPPVT